MQKIKVAIVTTLLCAGALSLAACDTAPAVSTVTPTASNPTVTVAAPGDTATTVTGATAQPTSNSGGNMQENIIVTDFQVWQDFMPSINKEGAPLHAALTLSVEGLDVTSGSGTLTLKRAGGEEEEIVTANLELMRQVDDLGLRQPGLQPVTYAMQSTSMKAPLTEGETVKGTAVIKFGSQERTIELPETQVFFTH